FLGIRLLIRLWVIVLKGLWKVRRAQAAWRDSSKDFTTVSFWLDYLKVKELDVPCFVRNGR
ncbi:MAG: hypothetical protein NC930_08835, partial [Candidatus Omnitrophica bacterium]|nr:hypothetical protein [Candidatus Omnitrophota bacterium]